MSPHKDPARKRRIRSKAARLRRRSVPREAAADRPVPPAEVPQPAAPVPTTTAPAPFGTATGQSLSGRTSPEQSPSTASDSTAAERSPSAEPGGAVAERLPSTESGGAVAERPASAGSGGVGAEGRPPLPVRGAASVSGDFGDDASGTPAVPPPFPPLSPLSAEELLADQPSAETLRRVRRGLRALPESDRHLSD